MSSAIKNKQTNKQQQPVSNMRFLFSEISARLLGAARQLFGCWDGVIGLEAVRKQTDGG